MRSLTVFRQQGVLSSWAFSDWLASRGTFKHHQLSGFKQSMYLHQQFSSERGQLPVKTIQEYVSAFVCFRELPV